MIRKFEHENSVIISKLEVMRQTELQIKSDCVFCILSDVMQQKKTKTKKHTSFSCLKFLDFPKQHLTAA